jgi:hypothetical protein
MLKIQIYIGTITLMNMKNEILNFKKMGRQIYKFAASW